MKALNPVKMKKKPLKTNLGWFIIIGVMLLITLAACQSGDQAETVESAPAASSDAQAEQPQAQEAESDADDEAQSDTEAEAEAEAPADTETAAQSDSPAESSPAMQTFQIVREQSEARFIIDEELRGSPKTVVGVTSLVAGEISLDPANPAQTQVGPIQIDARDLTTDDNKRNGAIRRFVLQSNKDEYQFITFTPTAIAGLPEAVNMGDTFEFQITGDLTIRDQTNPETFTVSVSADAENEISGLASATVVYADYGLFIPDVPFIANVADEVKLELEFVAAGG